MKITKRIMAMLLSVIMIAGMIPVTAQAQEEPQATVENGDVQFEGSNSLGWMLEEEIQTYQTNQMVQEAAYPAGYGIHGLTVEGNGVRVDYTAAEDAQLTVAIYSEDGLQLITSGTVAVSAAQNQVQVTIPEMPEYFRISAYLLDAYSFVPLCAAYETPMYTQKMQQLLASTVADYDAKRVWNLDEDDTTNFAVFSGSVLRVEGSDTTNTLVSADRESAVYVFENAQSSVRRLSEGKILAWERSDGEMIIVKVAQITVDGTTVTITGGDVTMEEVFSHIKIEESADNSDLVRQDAAEAETLSNTASTYLAKEDYDVEEEEKKLELEFVFGEATDEEEEDKVDKEKETYFVPELDITGTIGVQLYAKLGLYQAEKLHYLELDFGSDLTVKLEVQGTLERKFPLTPNGFKLSLGKLGAIGFEPRLVVAFSVTTGITGTISTKTGFVYERGLGIRPKPVTHDPRLVVPVEGEFKLVVDWKPVAEVADGWLVELSFPLETGVSIAAKLSGKKFEGMLNPDIIPEEKHDCNMCLALEANLEFSLSVALTAVNCEDLGVELELFKPDWTVLECYYCFDKDQFDWGKCPYRQYLTTVYVRYKDGTPVDNTMVAATSGENNEKVHTLGATDENGILTVYLYGGTYRFMTTVGKNQPTLIQTIEDPCKVLLVEPEKDTYYDETVNNILYALESDRVIDDGVVLSNDSNQGIQWKLYGTGYLHIWGAGELWSVNLSQNYEKRVTKVQIDSGITTIENYAFNKYEDMMEVAIPATVTKLGRNVFAGCESLTKVSTLENVTEVGDFAFSNCRSLRFILDMPKMTVLPNGTYYNCDSLGYVEIPDRITQIGYNAFSNCDGLFELILPEGLTEISDQMAYKCGYLTDVYIPSTVKSIGQHAFSDCEKLDNVDLPVGLETIQKAAFQNCYALSEILIPDTVTQMGEYAFHDCTSMVSAWLSENMTEIPEEAFSGCSLMESVEIPDSIVHIGDSAFWGCESLNQVDMSENVEIIGGKAFMFCKTLPSLELPETVTSIGHEAFYQCFALADFEIPSSVTEIGYEAFKDCDSLISLEVPYGVTMIYGGTFAYCSRLEEVILPETVTYLSAGNTTLLAGAFQGCPKLTYIEIPDSVETIASRTFADCKNLASVDMGNGVKTISGHAFARCESLGYIVIPGSVTDIASQAFQGCDALNTVMFLGDAPNMDTSALFGSFAEISFPATFYYPGGNATWTPDKMPTYESAFTNGPLIIWVPMSGSGTLSLTPVTAEIVAEEAPAQTAQTMETDAQTYTVSPGSVFGGTYTTDITDNGVEKTASFTGLVPNMPYTILALVSITQDDPFAPDNLLYIGQQNADGDGKLDAHYIQRVPTDTSYVMAFGAPYATVADATVTFPALYTQGEVRSVEAKVVHEGKTLTEGVDYILAGTVSFSQPGTYACIVRGIQAYGGEQVCTYTVQKGDQPAPPAPDDGGNSGEEGDREVWPNPFVDVSEDKYYYDAVLWAYYNNVTKGKDATHFDPTGQCTRSQVVTFLWRAAGEPEPASSVNPFPDVPEGKFYTKAVLWAVEKGITNGFKDGSFGPNKTCTRGQIVTFLWRYCQQPVPGNAQNPFPDVDLTSYCGTAVLWAVEAGITNGYKDGTFGPNKTCTRDQIVAFLYRCLVN